MLIKSLELTNFKQYKQQSIKFSEGLTGLVGMNGAGKSTIFDAITFVLYGPTGNVVLEDLKNDHAGSKEHVEVTLCFTENNRDYKIVRSLRGANATSNAAFYRIEEDGVVKTIAEKVGDVKKELFKVIKLDRNSFVNSFFAKQKETAGLLDISPGKRDKEIRRMLGLDRLDKLSSKITEKIGVMKAEASILEKQVKTPEQIEEMQSNISVKKAELTVLEGKLRAAKEVVQTKTTEKAEAQTKVDELRTLEKAYTKLQKEITRLKTQLDSINKSIADTESEITRLENLKTEGERIEPEVNKLAGVEESLADQNTKKANFKLFETTSKNIDGLKSTLAEQNAKLASLGSAIEAGAGLDDALLQKQASLSQLEENKGLLDSNLADVTREHTNNTATLKQKTDRKAKIDKLDDTAPCEECERELHDHKPYLQEKYAKEIAELGILCAQTSARKSDLEAQVAEKKLAIKAVEKEINDLKIKISNREKDKTAYTTLEAEITSTKNKIAQTETDLSSIGPCDFDQEEIERLSAEKTKLDALNKKYNQILGEIRLIPGKRDGLVTLFETKTQVTNALRETEASVTGLDFNPDALVAADSLYKAKGEELIEAMKVQSNAEIASTTAQNEVLSLENGLLVEKSKIAEYDSAKKEVDLLINYRNIVDSFKQRITSEALPKISFDADELFRGITHDRYNSLRIDPESFEIKVKRENKDVPLETLSGGEKDLAAVCLRVAISRHIVSMNGAGNLGFLALDEVFGSQDEGRRGELLNALQQISDKFSQVFIVSHNQDVQEAFPNRLIISKSGHYSVINQKIANN